MVNIIHTDCNAIFCLNHTKQIIKFSRHFCFTHKIHPHNKNNVICLLLSVSPVMSLHATSRPPLNFIYSNPSLQFWVLFITCPLDESSYQLPRNNIGNFIGYIFYAALNVEFSKEMLYNESSCPFIHIVVGHGIRTMTWMNFPELRLHCR